NKYLHEKIRETKKNNYKVLNELLVPVQNRKIIDENYIEKLDLGTLLLANNIESDKFNYFAVTYQKHSIHNLNDYGKQEKEREFRTFKNQGINLHFINTSELIFNKINAIQYNFVGKVNDTDFDLNLLVFKHNDYYYKISYKVDKDSE